MGVGLVFLLGIANFALHRAAVESGHPLLGMIRESSRLFAPRVTYGVEFVLLVAALMLAHGDADEIVAPARGEASRDALLALGYPVQWHSYPMGHSVCPEEVGDLNRWLLQVLA